MFLARQGVGHRDAHRPARCGRRRLKRLAAMRYGRTLHRGVGVFSARRVETEECASRLTQRLRRGAGRAARLAVARTSRHASTQSMRAYTVSSFSRRELYGRALADIGSAASEQAATGVFRVLVQQSDDGSAHSARHKIERFADDHERKYISALGAHHPGVRRCTGNALR
jgi:hypothetical protein